MAFFDLATKGASAPSRSRCTHRRRQSQSTVLHTGSRSTSPRIRAAWIRR
jgi:hypothetical protein